MPQSLTTRNTRARLELIAVIMSFFVKITNFLIFTQKNEKKMSTLKQKRYELINILSHKYHSLSNTDAVAVTG